MTKVIEIDNQNSLKDATQILKKGGILVFPTDTVYGIGCLMMENAIPKLYKIKNRPETQPTAVLMSRNIFDAKRIRELILDNQKEEEFLTGTLTVIDSVDNYAIDFPIIITAQNTIGVRLPKYEWLEKLIDEVGPIVATSANKKGDITPKSFKELKLEHLAAADLVIKTQENLGGTPSSVFDLTNDKVLR